jgi:Na+-translocating ferredoxin:NAD+ oxidoreductase RnfD subunit
MRKLLQFFRTPKGLLTILLLILTAIAAPGEGVGSVLRNMGAAVLAAGIVDLLILRVRNGAWEYPSGAVLTAMIVAMVMRAQDPWQVPVITSVVAVLSKYLIRSRQANVFNPAALALVLMFYLMPHGQSWWGALPDVTLGDSRHVAEIFRSPDIDAVIYFTLVILTDPPTSPAKYKGQWVFGIIAAVVSYAVFMQFGVVYFLLAGVLAGNVWEAWRRVHRQSRDHFPRKLAVFFREISPLRSAR